ncbi:MAG: hypothetical protein ACE5PV_24470 [Candidatus Poribacteria bacterium]
MAEVQIKPKAELHPLLDEFFQNLEIVEVEVKDTELIFRKPEDDVVRKTHGTIKIRDRNIIQQIAESEEFSASK